MQRLIAASSILLAVLLLIATAARVNRSYHTPGPYDPARQGFLDFHCGVYFPSKAFIEHVSPYGAEYAQEFPVPRSSPFFSPVAFAVHAPWALLPLATAEVLYFAWMVFLVGAISVLLERWLAEWDQDASSIRPAIRSDRLGCIFLAIVFSRGGHQTFFTGYFTFEMILASLVAVQYGKSRPWLSALALVVVSFKPNYVIPLGMLMLARGNIKSIVLGGSLSILLAAFSFAWIMPEGGPKELLDQISMTQEIHHADENERPVNTWIRLDVGAVLAKWLAYDPNDIQYLAIMLVILLPVAWLLHAYHRQFPEDSGSVVTLSGGVLLLTTIVSIYHHVYDSLLMFGLAAALIWGTRITPGSLPHNSHETQKNEYIRDKCLRIVLALGLFFPSLNYASSQQFIKRFEIEGNSYQWITSINAIALLAVWLALVAILAWHLRDFGRRRFTEGV